MKRRLSLAQQANLDHLCSTLKMGRDIIIMLAELHRIAPDYAYGLLLQAMAAMPPKDFPFVPNHPTTAKTTA